jgi:inosine-5''-monophosphate dehydrogenase (EC 1.1.1.205)
LCNNQGSSWKGKICSDFRCRSAWKPSAWYSDYKRSS